MQEEQYPRIFLYRRLVQAKLYIDTHYADAIDLDQIAGEVYSSKYHFIRQFKSIYFKTPHQYLMHVRIDKAQDLLKTGATVTAACYLCGFESLGSFSTLFKRMSGITPQAYRLQHETLRLQVEASPFSFIPACFARQSGWL